MLRKNGSQTGDKPLAQQQADAVVVGGGLAGIVTTLDLLRAGRRVTLIDRDTPERFGGLALWAFGGMALVGTPLQARMKIPTRPSGRSRTGCALPNWPRMTPGRWPGRATTSSTAARRSTTGCSRTA